RGEVAVVAACPNGQRVAGGCWDGSVLVWNPATGERLLKLQHPAPVTAAAFTPDSRTLVTADSSATLKIWSATTGRLLASRKGRVCTTNHEVKLLDTRTFQLKREISSGPCTGIVVLFTPEGKLITGSQDGTIRVWDPAAGHELAAIAGVLESGDWFVSTPEG